MPAPDAGLSLPYSAPPLLEKGVDDGADRNSEEHAHKAEGAAADRDQGEGVDGGQAERSSDDSRIDQVALKLLEDNQENEEEQGLKRRLHGDHDCPDDRTHKGAVYRDECRDTDQDSYHRRVRQGQKQHARSAQTADDDGLKHLCHNEVPEGPEAD